MKTIYSNSIGVVVITALFLFWSASALAKEPQRMAMWVVRDQIKSPESIDKIIDFAQRNGFTDLFVQVRGRGDAFYKSSLVPRSQNLPKNEFDPLKYILDNAHPKNLKIHAWINMFLLWSSDDKPQDKNHLYYRHPEWLSVDADGVKDINRKFRDFNRINTEGIYLSPLVPEVNDHLVEVVKEIVENYNVDGIHLDYIRYPKNCYDFNDIGRRRFKEIYAVDPILLSISNKSFFSGIEANTIETLMEKWAEFRQDAITELIVKIRETIITTRKPIVLSAAVKPDPFEARNHFYQDWEKWLKLGYIDFAAPMNYTSNAELFEGILLKIDPLITKEKIWMGIGVYNQGRYEALSKIMVSYSNGYDQLVFFSYKTLANQPNYFPTLRKAFSIEK
ncbi:MAG: family 10 glycosylhydrolase [Candidatus Marinimicrobia bacterium]|nr:family 10 glycosylhydrolase [Candidatus Neomarinimicrobiota bacterium]